MNSRFGGDGGNGFTKEERFSVPSVLRCEPVSSAPSVHSPASSYNLMMHSTLVVAATALLLLPAPSAAQSAQTRQSPSRGLTELSQSLQELAERGEPERRPGLRDRICGAGRRRSGGERASARAQQRLRRHRRSPTATSSPTRTSSSARRESKWSCRWPRPAALRAARSLRRRGRVVGAQIVAVDQETDIAVLKVDAEGAAGAGVRRFRCAASGTDRAGVRQPARAGVVGDDGRGQRRGAAADARGSDDLHPDRRAHQPRQQRRRARRHRRTPGRHQHAHLLAVGRQRGHRLRRARATSSRTSSRRSARPGACGAARSASTRRR